MSLSYEVIRRPKYKFRLTAPFQHQLTYFEGGGKTVNAGKWASLDLRTGLLTLSEGYAWDGASGPALNTVTILRASLVHDALYQMIAIGLLPKDPWKRLADREFKRICERDGMWWLRRNYAFLAVRLLGRAVDQYDEEAR